MKYCIFRLAPAALLLAMTLSAIAAPPLINYQGRVVVGTTNFDGTGYFKFALVNSTGTLSYWRNDGTSGPATEPATAIPLPVTKGLYSILLGEVPVTAAIPASVFTNADLRLRVWFNDGTTGFQLLAPDQRLAPAAYLADGAVTVASIADQSITGAKIAAGAIGTAQLGDQSVTAAKVLTAPDWSRYPGVVTITGSAGNFGAQVAAVGADKVLVSAPNKRGPNPPDTDFGGAYLYDLAGNLLRTYDNPTPATYDRFGTAIASVGADKVLIAAPRAQGAPSSARGEACLYDLQGNLLRTFTRPGSSAGTVDYFGTAVAAVGTDKVLISAVSSSFNGVYLFDLSGNLLRTYSPPASAVSFGAAVAAVGSDKVLIAAKEYPSSNTAYGRAYLYDLQGNLLATLDNPTPATLEYFGTSVAAIGSDKVLISTNPPTFNPGGAYLFDLSGTLLKTFAPGTPVAGVETDKVLFGSSLYDTTGALLKTFTDSVGSTIPVSSSAAIAPDKVALGAYTTNKVYLFTRSSYAPGIISDGARAGTVTTDSLAAGAVQRDKIAAGAVDTAQVAAGAIDYTRLSVTGFPSSGQVLGYTASGLTWTGATSGPFFLSGSNAYFTGGYVGLGTTSPQRNLHLYDPSQSVSELIETGGGTNAWTQTRYKNLNGEWVAGTSRSFNSDVYYIDRIGTTALDFTLATNGNLGLGVNTPQAKLDMYDPAGSISQRIATGGATNSWTKIEFANGNGQWDVGTTRGFQNDGLYFFRQGATALAFAIQTNGDAILQGTMSCKVLTIRGGADLAEPFPMKEDELDKGSVVVIDDEHPGRLKRSRRAYDTRVAGIISGANGVNPGIALHQEGVMEGGQNVALSGRVYVQADASNGPIKPGDLLTTSDIPGHAMKVVDHGRGQGAVIGKAMSSLPEGRGLVLVLVTLQ